MHDAECDWFADCLEGEGYWMRPQRNRCNKKRDIWGGRGKRYDEIDIYEALFWRQKVDY